MRFVVLFDACVLYPAPLRDFLLHLTLTDLFAARWTERIHDEWIRNLLAQRPELEPARLQRTRELMNRSVPDCLVENYEPLIAGLELPDPDDRHVLAAAIKSGAQVIVTFNLKDFPAAQLEPYGIEALHPDVFVEHQLDLREAAVVSAIKAQRAALQNPEISAERLLETLGAQGLVVTADRLAPFADLI